MKTCQIICVHVLLLMCCASPGKAGDMKYKDPKQPINVRIKDLMRRMTLAEKIGQMTQIEREVASAQVMKDYFIGKTMDLDSHMVWMQKNLFMCVR